MRQQTKKKGSTAPSIHRPRPVDGHAWDKYASEIVTQISRSMIVTKFLPEGPRPPPKKYEMVVAGNYEQFKAWCLIYGKNPHDRGNLRYLADSRWIEGWDATKLVFVMVGTSWKNPVVQAPAYKHAIQLGVEVRHDRLMGHSI